MPLNSVLLRDMESVFSPREIPTPTIETDLWMHLKEKLIIM